MFRDIDTIGTTISDEGKITGELNLIGERGENDSILIGAPYESPPELVNDILGFPAGVGVELDYARVRFYVRNGDRGEEVEMEVELLGREIGKVEFERSFKAFSKSLNGRLRGKISETGVATCELEIEGPATVDFGSLTVGTRPGTGGARAGTGAERRVALSRRARHAPSGTSPQSLVLDDARVYRGAATPLRGKARPMAPSS